MFFPKKLTFLQYWVYLKQNSIESVKVGQKYNTSDAFQKAKNKSKLLTKPLLSHSPISQVPIAPLSSSTNSRMKLQSNLGSVLAQPKPWYSYWILPFVGFISVLPNLTPFRGGKESLVLNESSYGFKYLNPIEKQVSLQPNNEQQLFKFMKRQSNTPFSQTSPSLLSTPTLASLYKNLRTINSLNKYSFGKPVWYSESNLTIASKKIPKSSLYSVDKVRISPHLGASSKTPKNVTNFFKLSNGLSFSIGTTLGKDLNPQLVSKHKTPVISHKTLETSFDLILKQLLFSKDIWFQDVFATKAMSTNSIFESNTSHIQGTNALLHLLKNVSQKTMHPDVHTSVGSEQNSVRYLTSYADALYFYTYIRNTSFDSVKGENIQNFPATQENLQIFIPVKSPLLTKLDYPNKIQESSTAFEKERMKNQSSNLTSLSTSSMNFKSYGNSFDLQVFNDSQTQEKMIKSQIDVSTNETIDSKNGTLPHISLRSFKSHDMNFQKYIHYIKSRLITSFQSIKYRHDQDVYIQPLLSSVNKKTFGTFDEDESKHVTPKIQSGLHPHLLYPKTNLLAEANMTQKTSVKVLNSLNLNKGKKLHNETIKNRRQSIEKLIRTFSFYSTKSSKSVVFSKKDKKQLQQLNSKPLQTLVQNIANKTVKSTSPISEPMLQSKKRFTLKTPSSSFMNIQNQHILKAQKQSVNQNINVQPRDLLRIKHFVFLSKREQMDYKHYRTLNVILKDEKLLYETLIRQNQKQKRRKKKRKRWTRRRRKRKRKLLRPIWTTIHLAKVINQRRLSNVSSSITGIISSNFGMSSRSNTPFLQKKPHSIRSVTSTPLRIAKTPLYSSSFSKHLATKDWYKLSKKALVQLTRNKRYKTQIKTVLKSFEKIQVDKTKRWLNELGKKLGSINSFNKQTNLIFSKNSICSQLEYNRIMYERLQNFLINYGTNTEKNWPRDSDAILPSLALTSSYSKVNSLHTKIIQNAPKEEWLWLFKYITGELPPYPINSSSDELRSIWAMSKLQSTNQWTGWKNFYYQEFKKGLTPRYELWQDKKPDKRYNVNNLKKRQYKHIKQIQRLRLAPQLDRGTYFALQRDLTKLTVLGSPYTQMENRLSDQLFVNRPIDKLRSTLKSLKIVSSNNKLKLLGLEDSRKLNQIDPKLNSYIKTNNNLNYQEQARNHASISQVITSPKKPILDLYATWWDSTEITGWGWKTIQYGAPWDRKTLYLPTKLTTESSLIYSPVRKQSFSLTNQTSSLLNSNLLLSDPLNSELPRSTEFPAIVLVATILLHICAFLGLLSLAEVRYTTKVNLILAYKLSSIPLKVINTTLSAFFKEKGTDPDTLSGIKTPNLSLNHDYSSLINNKKNVKLFASMSNDREKPLSTQSSSPSRTLLELPTSGTFNSIVNIYKLGLYGSLKQLFKKVLRYKNTQRSLSSASGLESIDFGAFERTSDTAALHSSSLSLSSQFPMTELSQLEAQKFGLLTTLKGNKLRRVGLKLSYSTYYATITLIENIIDNFRDTTRSIYDFFSLPENFSPNPDEVGLDVLANFIYDFEEPLIELLPDIVETQSDKYLDRYLLTLSLLGPFGLFVQQRCKWFYRMFIGLLYEADADYRKDEEELHILYTIWAEVLNKAAEDLDLEASVIASQEDQRILLLEHLLGSPLLEYGKSRQAPQSNHSDYSLIGLINNIEPIKNTSLLGSRFHENHQVLQTSSVASSYSSIFANSIDLVRTRRYQTAIELFRARQFRAKDSNLVGFFTNFISRMKDFSVDISDDVGNKKLNLSNSHFVSTWIADQYVLYKTDETDLFIEINVPKSFATLPAIKYWDTLHQPIGVATCQIYSGILTKQMAKNILLIADNTAEKTQILQALAGETEVKLILDNSSRYASISQSVAVGMRLLRDVFDAVALQTPCIFVLEDIHLIGEKRPFLISDEDLALVTNSGLGLEQHQLYEKIQKIQQHSKHRISYFKKAYRGDAADSLPTNLLCYELFTTDQPRTEWRSSNYPIPIDFHSDLNDGQQSLSKAPQLSRPGSHLLLSETHVSHDTSNQKISHFVPEPTWSTKFDENQQKNNTSSSLRGKVSSIADSALTNISVKLDRITQLLVIMDNVRKNKGFIVFGTTNKPQILDPALRRPGRLEETIYLPSIPNILTKWEILNSQMKSSHTLPMKVGRTKTTLDMFNIYSNIQKTPILHQKNLLLTLAQCLQNNQRASMQTSDNFTHNSKVQKPNSILKKQFISQLLTEPKIKSREIRQIIDSSHLVTQNVHPSYSKFKKFLNEVLGTSYEQTAKSLFEILIHQTSSGIFLFNSAHLIKQLGSIEDTIYLKLYSSKQLLKNELSFVFAGIIANYFATFAQTRTLKVKSLTMQNMTTTSINSILDTTKDHNWQIATSLIYAYIQKRAIFNKNLYIQKLFNRHLGSINGFASPPTTSLLLPAKRYENYLRAERDYEQTSLSQRTLSLQNKIEFHINQRVLKRLYRLPIKEFYKSEIIENSLTTFSSSNLVLPRNTRNFVQQNTQSNSNFYYRNIFLNRHRHYLTNQWWTGHLTEYNIENTVMSEIDFRSYFVDKTKINGFTGDLILDFPDADQHYNLKHRRWYLSSTSWKSWYDLEKGLTPDIMNHYIIEVYTQTYRVLNSNRELLDHYVSKLLVNYQLQEIELVSDMKRFI